MIVSLGLPVPHHHGLYNAAALLVDGRLAGLIAKRFLAGDGIHYEPRWFKPWPRDNRRNWSSRENIIPSTICTSTVAGCGSGLKSARTPGVADRPGHGPRAPRRGCDPQSQRQSLPLSARRRSAGVRLGRFAGIRGQLHLQQLAGERSRAGDLRWRRNDRLGRKDAGLRPAVLFRRLATHHGHHRCGPDADESRQDGRLLARGG